MTFTANTYATYADLVAYLPNSGNITQSLAEQALEGATRQIESHCARRFNPSIEARYFDTPARLGLCLKDDLLEVLTITNGDGTTVASTDYWLWPYNLYPKSSVDLYPGAGVAWELSTTKINHGAISINGVWGFHQSYTNAWAAGSTLSSAITTTTATSAAVTSGTLFTAGQVVRIENELLLVTAVSSNTLTVIRGWNGSTAATHSNGTALTIWKPQADIARACLQQASRLYRRQEAVFGTIGGGEMGAQSVEIPTLDPDVVAILAPYRIRF